MFDEFFNLNQIGVLNLDSTKIEKLLKKFDVKPSPKSFQKVFLNFLTFFQKKNTSTCFIVLILAFGMKLNYHFILINYPFLFLRLINTKQKNK